MAHYYSYSVDIWSVGCIFAELLGMMKSNFSNFEERKPLFPGSTGDILSPNLDSEELSDDEKDQ